MTTPPTDPTPCRCQDCHAELSELGPNRAYRPHRLIGESRTLCLECWAERLDARAARQQRWLFAALLVNLVCGIAFVSVGRHERSLSFAVIGLLVCGIYAVNRYTHRLIRRELQRLRDRS